MRQNATPEYVEASFRAALARTFPDVSLPGPGTSYGLRVVLGAGDVAPSDWVCVDSRDDYPRGPDAWELVATVGKGRIRDDATEVFDRIGGRSCSAVYAHHVVEHLPIWKWIESIRNWGRLLRIGGVIYLSQPDLEAVAARTLEGISPGSAEAWFNADPKHRTWPDEGARGLDPVASGGGTYGAWEWLYCGGAHLSVPSEAHVRRALEPVGVEVRRARFDLSKVEPEHRRFVSLCATYVGVRRS